jgi:hypothetical protein
LRPQSKSVSNHAKIGNSDTDVSHGCIFRIVVSARFSEPLRCLANEKLAGKGENDRNSERLSRH